MPIIFFLFIFGLAIGSFLNVVALRYDGEHFVLDPKVIGGRSHCPHCGKTLHAYELIPVLSFLMQRGKCRNCEGKLSLQYPVVELCSGLIFAFVPLRAELLYRNASSALPFIALWILVFELLLLISVIDFRLGIIPDELNIAIAAAAVFLLLFSLGDMNAGSAFVFSRFIGMAAGGIFFLALVLVTPYIFKAEGMGMGDVKLAAALGFFYGWPDIAFVSVAAFILGAVVGVLAIALRRKKMKETMPFGPFLAAGSVLIFFWGAELLHAYVHLIGLR